MQQRVAAGGVAPLNARRGASSSLRGRGNRPRVAPVVACASPPPELLVLDFERGLSAGGGALQPRGLAAALSFTSLPFYVLSDAPPHAIAVLREAADVELAETRVFARTAAGLRAVAARPLAASASRVRLVSGDAALLAAAAAEPATAGWALHAAAWCQEQERGQAAQAGLLSSGVSAKPLPLDALVELLNFGLLMGVGDGCQEKFDAQGNELESN